VATKLITYDLNKEIVRPNIVGAIKQLGGSWAKLSESSYATNTPLTTEQIYQRLKPLLDANDHIYIITLQQPHSGYGPTEVNQWLAGNL